MKRLVWLMGIGLGWGGCSEPPTHKGVVTDRWGKPIAGATVALSGSSLQLVSGPDGGFTIPVQKSAVKIRAGKPGFIKKTLELVTPSGEEKPTPVRFALYPDPETPGFYGVTSTTYAAVESRSVKTVGTDIRAFTGLSDVGSVRLKGGKALEFIFSSNLRRSELKQLDLQLHKLKFLEEDSVPGVLGDTPVRLNLWVADAAVPFDLTGMETEDDYTLKTRTPPEPGMYAFHTQGVLTSKDPTALDKLPSEMRISFPFEVR